MFDFFSFFARMGSITVSNLNGVVVVAAVVVVVAAVVVVAVDVVVVVVVVVADVVVVVVVVENEFPVKKKKSPFFSSIENSFRLTFFRTKVEVQTDLSQLLKILWSWRTKIVPQKELLKKVMKFKKVGILHW